MLYHLLSFLAYLVLTLTVLFGAAAQWHWRTHQQVDIGSALDQGYVDYFSEREQSEADPALTFRWSQSWSRLQFWPLPPDETAILTLAMLAPPQPDGPQQVALSVAEQPLADIALTIDMRRYSLLLPPQGYGDVSVVLESEPLPLNDPEDARELGVSLASAHLTVPGQPEPIDLLRELWTPPMLPLGLLLLVLWAFLLRLPPFLMSGLPALSLAVLLLIARAVPGIGLPLALYLSTGALVATLVLAIQSLLQGLPAIYPGSDRAALAWIAALFVLALLATFRPQVNSDGVGYYVYLRSLTMDGDLQFANDYAAEVFLRPPTSMSTTPTGHVNNPWSVGPALFWAPLYGVAHLLVLCGQVLGLPWQPSGYASPYLVLSMFTSALAGLVLLVSSYRICRRFVSPSVAVLAVVSLFFGSNLLYYTMQEGSFAHAISAATASLYLLAWLRLEEQPTVGRWAALGAAAGAMTVVYWIGALTLLLPALTFGRLLVRALRQPASERMQPLKTLLLGSAAAAGLFLLLFSPQMLAWRVLFGSFLTIPQGEGYASPGAFIWGEFFFSTLHGMLPWTPAFFVGMIGVVLLWWRRRWLTVCLLLAMLLYLWYNASIPNWHGSGAFGLRRLTLLAPWFAIGLALLYERLERWHPVLPSTLATLMSVWTMLLMVRYHMYMIPHDINRLYMLPDLAFYFSRDALPLAKLPVLLYDGYFWGVLTWRPFSAARALEAAVLLVLLGLALWGLFSLFKRFRTLPLMPCKRPQAAAELLGASADVVDNPLIGRTEG